MLKRNIIFIAPFTPDRPSEHLGAEKKIELVIRLLHSLGYIVHLVDSSHSFNIIKMPVYEQSTKLGDIPITLWAPFCLPSRKIGKLLNIIFCKTLLNKLTKLNPEFVWVYNSYSFEARAAIYLKRTTKAKVILELEDLPTSRSRSFNPKPLIDQWFFPRLLRVADLVTYVNASIQRRFNSESCQSMLFPSLLQKTLVDTPNRTLFTGKTHRVGYFGGLEHEKGADVLLAAVSRLPLDWKLVITGVGSMSKAFHEVQQAYPDSLEFHGRVAHEEVMTLMLSCDAIVNPHTPISLMNEGVFPFKVCEALASGALLLTTALPSIDIDLSDSVFWFDGSAEGFVNALSQAHCFYQNHVDAVEATRNSIRCSYSEDAVIVQLRAKLDSIAEVV